MDVQSLLNRDRLFWVACLVVACLVAVLLLPSQSRASYPSYALALVMLMTVPHWRDVFALRIVWLVVGFLAWMALSAFWSSEFSWREAASVWTRCLLVFLFVIAVAECQLRGQLQRWMTNALTLVGVIVVLAAVVMFYWTSPEDGRLNGLGQLDTHVIAALVYGVVLLFVLRFIILSPAPWQKGAGLVVGLVILTAVYLSDSRNAWVSVSIGALVFVLAHKIQDVRQFVAVLAGAGVLLAVALILAMNSEVLSALLLPRGDSFRLDIWSETLAQLPGHWLVGLGILTNDDLHIGGLVFQHPHSMYLAVTYQAGLIGLLGYLGIVAWTLWILVRNYTSPDAKLSLSILVLALTAYLLDGHELVDKVGSSWFLIWLPVAMAIGLRWSEPDFTVDEQ